MKRLLVTLILLLLSCFAVVPAQAGGTGVVSCVGLVTPVYRAVVIEWNWRRPHNPIKSRKVIADPAVLYALMNLSGRSIWIGGSIQTWERPPDEMFHLSTYEVHLIPAGYGDDDSDHYAIIKVFDNDTNWNESYVLAFPAGIPALHPCFAAGVSKGGLYWLLAQAR